MKKYSNKKVQKNVLLYDVNGAHPATVLRQYIAFRKKYGVPIRCDNPRCQFHTADLVWRGAPLRMVLDHKNGFRKDNSPFNLRFLCPNCNSQLPTQGGGNIGRIRNVTHYSFEISSNEIVVYPEIRGEVVLDEDGVREWLSSISEDLP